MSAGEAVGYELLDSGGGRKLERFGERVLDRPCPQAGWSRSLPGAAWDNVDARFESTAGGGAGDWQVRGDRGPEWRVPYAGLTFQLALAASGQVGLFPEHRAIWRWIADRLAPGERVLNLFAHTGGATLSAARAGAEVCHVDGSRPAVARARENAAASGLAEHPVRWIVDDVGKFVGREIRRGRRYHGVLLDPPAFGRGPRGERWQLEEVLDETLARAFELLEAEPRFVVLSAHSKGFDQGHLVRRLRAAAPVPGGLVSGDLVLEGPAARPVPSGAWAAWVPS